jgi:5-methylcytosine-specific restriction endonuclease McrA
MGRKKVTLSKLTGQKRAYFGSSSLTLSNLELKIRSVFLGDYHLGHLEQHKEHRRLKVFYHKGTTCVSCGVEGIRIIKRMVNGSVHLDVYTKDLVMMTVDHIIPKSLGGDNSLDNLRPMCLYCNSARGNALTVDDIMERMS